VPEDAIRVAAIDLGASSGRVVIGQGTARGFTLREVHGCIDEGLDVRGYFVWSLLDNFEWNMGYGPKLGLHAVDRTTFERQPKPSAAWFADVARTGRLGSAGH